MEKLNSKLEHVLEIIAKLMPMSSTNDEA